MNRHDEWRRDREWGGGRQRDDEREDRHERSSFHPGNPGFDENLGSARTAGDDEHQPYSENPYGRYPGQQQRGRGGDEWYSAPPQRYGQREPYNAGERGYGGGGGSRRPSPDTPTYRGSRYSENQYGQYGGGRSERGYRQRGHEGSYERGGGIESRFDQGRGFGEGPFSDRTDSPRYFGSGNYGDGGASYTGGYDQREGARNYGSLYSNPSDYERQLREQTRYRSGPKGYTRSDERLREDISERLMLANGIDSSEVSVSVKDAKVTLEGSVPNRRMKHAIEDLADQCPGVQDVDNRIRVKREEWGSSSGTSNTMSASGVTPTSGSSGTTSSGRGRKE